MRPVVGIDVAKGKSVIQAFLRRNVPYGRDQQVLHTSKGFTQLSEMLDELKKKSGEQPCIILEPTGHYHRVIRCRSWPSFVRKCWVTAIRKKNKKSSFRDFSGSRFRVGLVCSNVIF